MSGEHESLSQELSRPEFRLPAELRVLGVRFRTEVVEHPTAVLDPTTPASHEALGSCDRSGAVIRIRGASVLSTDVARVTYMHEVLHAIIGTARIEPFGDMEAEEKLVAELAPLLLHTLRDNPDLIAAIISR